MSLAVKAAFFDGIADKWDGWDDLGELGKKLSAGLDDFGVGADETVIDVGCGTGNLTSALLRRLSPRGRVFATDLSARMIEVARSKIADERVDWHLGDAARLPLGEGCCDRVICYSVWPHFEHHASVALEIARVLRPRCPLHIWHLMGREQVNAIHAGAGDAVREDVLVAASETADLLVRTGYDVTTCVDTQELYLITAIKRGT